MAIGRPSWAGIPLIGLPVLSNMVSFVIFAPLFTSGTTASPDDFQRAGILFGIAILVIEVITMLWIVLSLYREHTSLISIINFQSSRVRSYLIIGLIALLPTLAAGWLYDLGQSQAGVESDLSQLTQGETILWYLLTPLATAFLEETIWRGYAIPRTKGIWRGLLLTSLSFALFHGIFNPLVVRLKSNST